MAVMPSVLVLGSVLVLTAGCGGARPFVVESSTEEGVSESSACTEVIEHAEGRGSTGDVYADRGIEIVLPELDGGVPRVSSVTCYADEMSGRVRAVSVELSTQADPATPVVEVMALADWMESTPEAFLREVSATRPSEVSRLSRRNVASWASSTDRAREGGVFDHGRSVEVLRGSLEREENAGES